MRTIEIIQKKRDQRALNKDEIGYLVENYVRGEIPDYQISAFLMAVFLNGMNDEETSFLTEAMLWSGQVITHKTSQAPLIDKHSTGGIGDKISIPLAPAMAACGLKVPMIAGRGLGHTGGTLDKLEAIPNFRCNLSTEEYKTQVAEIGCVIMGQTSDIAPADKKLYALRDVTGTVESIPLIASSIMSKKLAEGIDGLVLDVKFGTGAFMKEIHRARALGEAMVKIGNLMGKKVTTVLTNMDQPIGRMVGNALEILESIDILSGKGPEDSMHLTIELGAEMLLLGNLTSSLDEGRRKVKEVLENGKALSKFLQMVRAQGGDENFVLEPKRLLLGPNKIVIEATSAGYLESIDSRAIGQASNMLGGGRATLKDIIDHRVGVEMQIKIGDKVAIGQPLCRMYAGEKGVDDAKQKIKNAFCIVPHIVQKLPLISDRITSI
jgi:pyrimidine-nucleoside phosphorylase/thymidine phosphorylase